MLRLSARDSLQLRLPKGTSDNVQDDPSGARALWDKGFLNAQVQKVCALRLNS